MTSYVWKGTPDEESRQQYATRRVQEYQAVCATYLQTMSRSDAANGRDFG